jgi:hypothetical protein
MKSVRQSLFAFIRRAVVTVGSFGRALSFVTTEAGIGTAKRGFRAPGQSNSSGLPLWHESSRVESKEGALNWSP